MSEHTGFSYQSIETSYAETVDLRPMNAYYERPAMLSLLPDLLNKKVLDVGCGTGWYSEQLVGRGAQVTAFDLNQEFVRQTEQRLNQKAIILQADLSCPLTFARDRQFDLVICPLVMHYLKSWQPVFDEFFRILKPGGILLFSTHHPFSDWKEFQKEDYFALDLLEDEWDIGNVQFYRRPLSLMTSDLYESGFCIERIVEPQPTESFRQARPEWYERLMKSPWFLIIRAHKLAAV
ncbi:MAG: class I SAM-dependent methyltransferase [Cyanobacteriota bacterium]|nr:class I SAM-dependent methyltransferase [Cyanobacteriota bacterium]